MWYVSWSTNLVQGFELSICMSYLSVYHRKSGGIFRSRPCWCAHILQGSQSFVLTLCFALRLRQRSPRHTLLTCNGYGKCTLCFFSRRVGEDISHIYRFIYFEKWPWVVCLWTKRGRTSRRIFCTWFSPVNHSIGSKRQGSHYVARTSNYCRCVVTTLFYCKENITVIVCYITVILFHFGNIITVCSALNPSPGIL